MSSTCAGVPEPPPHLPPPHPLPFYNRLFTPVLSFLRTVECHLGTVVLVWRQPRYFHIVAKIATRRCPFVCCAGRGGGSGMGGPGEGGSRPLVRGQSTAAVDGGGATEAEDEGAPEGRRAGGPASVTREEDRQPEESPAHGERRHLLGPAT